VELIYLKVSMARRQQFAVNPIIFSLFIITMGIMGIFLIVLLGIGTSQDIRSRAASTATKPAPSGNYSITLNEASPHYGQSVSFTEVYPREAEKKIGRQQMFQPGTQVDCYQNHVRVYSNHTWTDTKAQNSDGSITAVTGFVALGGTANGWTWTAGAGTCYATLYYFTTKDMIYNFIAQTQFEVLE
jgi:hypothetical protein